MNNGLLISFLKALLCGGEVIWDVYLLVFSRLPGLPYSVNGSGADIR